MEKDIEKFPRASGFRNNYRRTQCTECYSIVHKGRKQAQKQWFDDLKKTMACADCGLVDFRVIEFHHVNPSEKEIKVSLAAYLSEEILLAELKKCIPYCVNCHRRHHAVERKNQLKAITAPTLIVPSGEVTSVATRICRVCHEPKPLDHYQKAGTVKGKTYQRHVCTTCKTEAQMGRKNNLKAWLAEYKKTLSCSHCLATGGDILDFHHDDSDSKELDVATAIGRGWSVKKITDEIAKCTILCGNCHRIHHHEERVAAKKKNAKAPCAVEKHPI